MNQQSSRSHFVLTFEVECTQYMDFDGERPRESFVQIDKKARIIFIDLAGSEKQSENQSLAMEEGCYINKSLSNLNKIILALSKKQGEQKGFQHYRDTKLTHYLKEVFSGNSHISIIGHVLPY